MIGTNKQLHAAQNVYDAMSEPEIDDTEAGLRYLIEHAEELIGRAERCIANGEIDAAIDMLKNAGRDLSDAGNA